MRSTPLVLSRRTAILSAAAALLTGASPRPKRVLFVCQKGTVKSPIARELARSIARSGRIALDVRSRGIAPTEGATPETAAALVRDGISVRSEPLRALTRGDLAWADVVVHFDPLPFAAPGKDVRNWGDTPSVNGNYAAALSDIRHRIVGLIDSLAPVR